MGMLDWVGSLRITERSSARIVLRLSKTTRLLGSLALIAGLLGLLRLWGGPLWLLSIPGVLAVGGLLLMSLERTLIIDRQAGVLEVHQKMFGIGSRSVVPLFHLRAVVVSARPTASSGPGPGQARYVAFLERRIGDAIYLDEARRCAGLLAIAEAIADVAELRLEYDASFQAN
jgi:hypothetical protein